MTDLLNMSVVDYLERLASEEPTPGGGSAAAVGGALSAALLGMVAHFTIGREKYAACEGVASAVLLEADRLRLLLQELAERDTVAYGRYREASALPKATDEEKTTRRSALQLATRASAEVPLEIARACSEVLIQASRLAGACNPYLISDVTVAVYLGLASLRSAVVNVRVNLALLDDEVFRAVTAAELMSLNHDAAINGRSALARSFQVLGMDPPEPMPVTDGY